MTYRPRPITAPTAAECRFLEAVAEGTRTAASHAALHQHPAAAELADLAEAAQARAERAICEHVATFEARPARPSLAERLDQVGRYLDAFGVPVALPATF